MSRTMNMKYPIPVILSGAKDPREATLPLFATNILLDLSPVAFGSVTSLRSE